MPSIKMPMQVVDMQTGEIKEEREVEWHVMPIDTSNGQCPECGRKHEPEWPHNQQSLAYQYHFRAQHNRWPTWLDAMAHCTPDMQTRWKEALREKGVIIGDEVS